MIKKIKVAWNLPQVRLFVFLLLLAIGMIVVSANISSPFFSSFFSNISAGLFTGLVICLISGRKTIYLHVLKEEKVWLQQVHSMIVDFFESMNSFRKREYNKNDEFEHAYDLVCKANWINEHISQSQFDKRLTYDCYGLCKKEFAYDSYSKAKDLIQVRDEIMEEKWDRKRIFQMFEPIEKSYRLLNNNICRKIESLDLEIDNCNKSVI